MPPSKTVSASDGGHPGVRHPVRPRLPPVLLSCIVVFGGTVAIERITWSSFLATSGADRRMPVVAALLIGLALLLVVAALRRYPRTHRRSWPVAMLLLALLLVVAALGLLYWGWWARTVHGLADDDGGSRTVRVVSDARSGLYGWTSEGLAEAGGASVPVTICWPDGTVPVPSGHTMDCYGVITPTRATEAGHRRHEEGTVGTLRAFNCEDRGPSADLRGLVAPLRSELRGRLALISGRGAALIAGLVLGDRADLSGTDIDADFRVCGLSHMVAVSGSHLAVVAALVDVLARRCRLGRRVRAAVLLASLILYTFLSGLQVSAVRALIMCAVGLGAGIVGRRGHPLGAVGLCGSSMVLVDPSCIFSLSFELSFCAVVGIVVFTPLATEWLVAATSVRLRTPMEMLALTFAAQATTLPLTVPRFSMLPLLSPLANLVVAAPLSLLIAAGLVLLPLSCILPRPLSTVVVGFLGALGEGVCRLVAALAQLPGMSLPAHADQFVAVLCCLVCLGAVWYLWPRPTRRRLAGLGTSALVVLLLAAAVWSLPQGTRLVMLDVGQGDALLLTCGRHAMLVDTGNQDALLLSELARNHIRHLDAVIITHLHDDHCGSLDVLRDNVSVDRVLFARPALDGTYDDSEALRFAEDLVPEEAISGVSPGDHIGMGAFDLAVLWPGRYTEDGGNADSLCMEVTCDADGDGSIDATMLLTGDAEHPTLAKLEEAGLLDRVDILKVGHHGSAVSVDDDDLAILQPQLDLVSVGEGNRYGHPDVQTMERLVAAGGVVRRTDEDGEVRVDFGPGGFSVSCDTM